MARDGELTVSFSEPVFVAGGGITSSSKTAPEVPRPARALAVDGTGWLVMVVNSGGLISAKAKLPWVRVMVDATLVAAELLVTLQLAGVSKPKIGLLAIADVDSAGCAAAPVTATSANTIQLAIVFDWPR